MSEPGSIHLTEQRIRELVGQYEAASERRDVKAMLELFADDAVIVIAPGAFRGKEAIRRVLDWDARTSPIVRCRPLGLGLLIKGNTAVREVVVETAYEGIAYEYANLVAFEFNDDGKIRARRSYYDKLGIAQRIARHLPGIQGYLLRLMVNYLVSQGEKGLHTPVVR
jgi:ketosteroid isomerase-like protein